MLKKSSVFLITVLALAACAESQPRIIQASSDNQTIVLTAGMATQIEMPDEGRVQSITVGNPALLSAEQNADVVNLMAKEGRGETNLIIRARNNSGSTAVYQYHVSVQGP